MVERGALLGGSGWWAWRRRYMAMVVGGEVAGRWREGAILIDSGWW